MKTNVGSFLSFDEFQSLNVTGRIYLDLNTFCFPHFVICYFDQNLHSKLDKINLDNGRVLITEKTWNADTETKTK